MRALAAILVLLITTVLFQPYWIENFEGVSGVTTNQVNLQDAVSATKAIASVGETNASLKKERDSLQKQITDAENTATAVQAKINDYKKTQEYIKDKQDYEKRIQKSDTVFKNDMMECEGGLDHKNKVIEGNTIYNTNKSIDEAQAGVEQIQNDLQGQVDLLNECKESAKPLKDVVKEKRNQVKSAKEREQEYRRQAQQVYNEVSSIRQQTSYIKRQG